MYGLKGREAIAGLAGSRAKAIGPCYLSHNSPDWSTRDLTCQLRCVTGVEGNEEVENKHTGFLNCPVMVMGRSELMSWGRYSPRMYGYLRDRSRSQLR
jgi:hypothetical protein